MPNQNRKNRAAAKTDYKPTERELAAVRRLHDAGAERAPSLKISEDGDHPIIAPDHPDEAIGYTLLMEALGTVDHSFLAGFLGQVADAGSSGAKLHEGGINFMLSVVKGIEPRDQLETMLAVQMAAVHMAIMTFARRLAHVDNIPQQDSAERAFNKLARTYVAQMEALKRYRTGGEQKVTVQHVTVGEGGQAIVGNVTQGQREAATEKAAASPLLLADAKTAPMPILQESKTQAPVSGTAHVKKK
jgi:hypothetical protein